MLVAEALLLPRHSRGFIWLLPKKKEDAPHGASSFFCPSVLTLAKTDGLWYTDYGLCCHDSVTFKYGFVGVFRLARTPVGSDALVAPRTEKTLISFCQVILLPKTNRILLV